MLYSSINGFLFTFDNFGANYTTAAFGSAVSQDAAANTKGANIEVISDASVTADCYGIAIVCAANNTAVAIRNYLIDIKTDPSGGTSYNTVIPNLIFMGASTATPQAYYFPLYISAGTAIACAAQCNVGSGTAGSIPRVGIRLFGEPINSSAVRTGSFVRAFGADTANSRGTAITPGNTVMGSYTASLGTTADALWYWQMGIGIADASMTDSALWCDAACGDATNKITCIHHQFVFTRGAEHAGWMSGGLCPPTMPIASGANVYARAAAAATPDATNTVMVYGLGG